METVDTAHTVNEFFNDAKPCSQGCVALVLMRC